MHSEIVFIDPTVEKAWVLLDGLDPGISVVYLDAGLDAVDQISTVLAGRDELRSVHLLCHGRPGVLEFAATSLSSATLDGYRDRIAGWGRPSLTMPTC